MLGGTGSNYDVCPRGSSHRRHREEELRLGNDRMMAQDGRRLETCPSQRPRLSVVEGVWGWAQGDRNCHSPYTFETARRGRTELADTHKPRRAKEPAPLLGAKAPQAKMVAGKLGEPYQAKSCERGIGCTSPLAGCEGLAPHRERLPLPASRLRFVVAFLGAPYRQEPTYRPA
jgi:hypothetical protein